MRIEGQDGRLPAVLAPDSDDAAENGTVSYVNAIEVANRENAGRKIGARLIEAPVKTKRHSVFRPHRDFQAVIRQPHIIRELFFGVRMWQVVTDVREVRALGTQLLYPLQ